MIDSTGTLFDLQVLDQEIEDLRERIAAFQPQLEEVEEPAINLEKEVTTTEGRLSEMQVEERRLERSSDDKRARLKKLEERLKGVRNVREEAAVQAEIGMVERALESAEQDALSLLDQIRRLELKLQEQQDALKLARDAIAPRRTELIEEREAAEAQLSEFEARRAEFAQTMDSSARSMYEAIKSGRRVAVTRMTEDGACGSCFWMVPLQLQNELRRAEALIRCQGCGVILTPPEAEDAEADDADAGDTEDGQPEDEQA